MSGIVLGKKATKGKDLSILTYEQVSDPENYGKKHSTPAVLVLDGMAPKPVGRDSRNLKPRVKPGFLGPLDDVTEHSDIPIPVQKSSTLKLKTYCGKSH
jgi:hypothetical protein